LKKAVGNVDCIIEFEPNGRDYGSRLLYRLAEALKKGGIKGISYTNLTLFRKFYLFYPQIGERTSAFLGLDTGKKNTLPNLQTMPGSSDCRKTGNGRLGKRRRGTACRRPRSV